MKKQPAIFYPILSFAFLLPLTGCAGQEKETVNVISSTDNALTSFAKEEILSSAKNRGVNEGGNGYHVRFEGVDESLPKQGYKTLVEGKDIKIYGGDSNGLLYGGLSVADHFKAHGSLSSYRAENVSPRYEERMLKLNAPLDMRCPSYSDTGSNAQAQIKDMWDLSFWKGYFDEMARNRYNAVNLWSLNPFPALTKVEGYEEVALNDVWKTKIPFDTSYAGNCSNAVQEKHWEEGSYEVIKKISIDEKIAHFNAVIDAAHNRGIKFYISAWNVYTFAEHGKYGITPMMDNKTTKDYLAKSVSALLDTYPKLDGLGVCTGECMPTNDIDLEGEEASTYKEKWVHDVYGEPLKAHLAKNPGKEKTFKLIHRMHFTNYDDIKSIWGDIPCTMDISTKYSENHMFANGTHRYAEETLNALPNGQRSLLELRNSDAYNLRFASFSFANKYFSDMDRLSKVSGIVMGSDGYCDGREYFFQDESFNGILAQEKHFCFYSLFGNLSYNPAFDEELYKGLFSYHFRLLDPVSVSALYNAMASAGNVIPTVSELYFSDGDATWYPEGNNAHPNSFGYLGLKRWINADNAHPYANCLSIAEYCKLIKEGSSVDEGKNNPVKVASSLLSLADNIEGELGKIDVTGEDKEAKEFLSLAKDQNCLNFLARFYAEKINSVIALREYNDLGKEEKKSEASFHMAQSIENYEAYAKLFHENYKPMWLTWTCDQDLNKLLVEAKKDQSAVDSWKPRKY